MPHRFHIHSLFPASTGVLRTSYSRPEVRDQNQTSSERHINDVISMTSKQRLQDVQIKTSWFRCLEDVTNKTGFFRCLVNLWPHFPGCLEKVLYETYMAQKKDLTNRRTAF